MRLVNAVRIEKLVTFLTSLVVLVALLSGCTQFTDTVPLGPDQSAYEIHGSRTAGQTFVCHHAGLNGISVLLRAEAGAGDVVLRLRESADSEVDIAAVTISPLPGTEPTFHRFVIPVQDDVNGQSFFLSIESPDTDAANAVVVPYSVQEPSSYTLYLDGVPLSGSLSFKLHYNSLFIVKDLGRQAVSFGLRTLWLLFLSALLYLLPGGAAVVWLLRKGDWIEQVIVALGLSVAIHALLMYATMTGLRLNPAMVIGFLALCGVLVAVRWWLDWRQGQFRFVSLRDAWGHLKQDPSPVVLLLVFVLVLGVRLFVVCDLVAPMWGDGYHHTMIAQLMVDNGGLFDSWEPYAPLKTFTYHFGFHANVALFHWLSGDSVIHSVIWIGQILNALAVLVLYPLALKVSDGNRWAGVGAVLVAGLLSPMPMYYVNWGRYVQLAGQVILPVLMWLTWQVVEKPKWDWQMAALTIGAVTGLGITHYRVVLIYGVFVVALGVIYLIRKWGQWQQVGQVALRMALIGSLTLLFFFPWGMRTFQARLPEIGQQLIREGNQSDFHRGEYNAIGDVSFYVPWELLILSVGALVWRICKQRFDGLVIVLWVGGLLILANPYLVYLPGTGIVNNFAIFIMFYVPVGILAGVFIGEMYSWVWCRKRWVGSVLVVIVVLGAGWGVLRRVRDLKLEHALVTKADMEAMVWIRENTGPDAKFLVNGFTAYGGTAVVGADAGWWIPLLTKRGNTIPPLMYEAEAARDPNYPEQVRKEFVYVKQVSPTSQKGVHFLQGHGVTHVYIGLRRGMVGSPGEPLLDVRALSNDPVYRLTYHRDGVWIFALIWSGG